uniref:Uncharacterized protein n=1 Tax=Panagrolaimus sp. JU765 TaxID=591449 RepID=A0AC34Q8J1_9BILA
MNDEAFQDGRCRPCLCESTSQFSCPPNYANRYPLPQPQIPSYVQNNGINLPAYPVIIRPNYPSIGSGAIPNFGGGVLKNVPCTPQKINVIINSDDGRRSWHNREHWYSWDWDSLWTPQGIALIITAIILILLILCLVIGLIIACIRGRSSKQREERVVVEQESTYHRY